MNDNVMQFYWEVPVISPNDIYANRIEVYAQCVHGRYPIGTIEKKFHHSTLEMITDVIRFCENSKLQGKKWAVFVLKRKLMRLAKRTPYGY